MGHFEGMATLRQVTDNSSGHPLTAVRYVGYNDGVVLTVRERAGNLHNNGTGQKAAHQPKQLVTLFSVLTISLPFFSYGQTQPPTSPPKKPVVRVPFVACKADGQVGPLPLPREVDKIIQANPDVAGRLAYYQSGVSMGVLAPRGWSCQGVYGSSGSAFVVTPEPIALRWPLLGPVVEVDSTSGGTSGRFEVATVVARVFPKYVAFVQQVIDLFDFVKPQIAYGPYPTDTLVYKDERTVEYRTPPNKNGLGTITGRLGEDSDWIDGVAMLEGETPDLLLLSVRLPADMSTLVPQIIHHLELEASQNPQ